MPDQLITDLHGLAGVVDLPEPTSVAARVMADPRLTHRQRPAWRPIAVGLTAVLVVLLVLPAPRQAIASLFGLGGVSITIVDELPEAFPTARPPGQLVSIDEAASVAEFEILLPAVDPDEVIIDLDAPVHIVSLVYQGRLVITEMSTSIDDVVLDKSVEAAVPIREVLVGTVRGLWIEGPHTLTYLDEFGRVRDLPPRLVANTLLFERGGITVRIETAGNLEAAQAIADSLRPHGEA